MILIKQIFISRQVLFWLSLGYLAKHATEITYGVIEIFYSLKNERRAIGRRFRLLA
jgi:hypothetical protein